MNLEPSKDYTMQVQAVLAESFDLPVDQIAPDLAFGDLPQWDSLGHMEMMMRLEERFGIEVTADTIAQLVSVPAICAYLTGAQEKE